MNFENFELPGEFVFEHLDQLSSRWSNLDVGQSMAVAWPDLNIL